MDEASALGKTEASTQHLTVTPDFQGDVRRRDDAGDFCGSSMSIPNGEQALFGVVRPSVSCPSVEIGETRKARHRGDALLALISQLCKHDVSHLSRAQSEGAVVERCV